MKLHLGCGADYKRGFVNCDIQDNVKVDRKFDCSDLSCVVSKSASLIFCHSFFEHLYLYQQAPFLEECKRALSDDGFLVILGIPDFEKICQLYLNKIHIGPMFNMPFNLYQAYRLTHGDYEDGKKASIPQMHKTIFDKKAVNELFRICGFRHTRVFNYAFPGEFPEIAIGITAFKGKNRTDDKIKEVLGEFKTYFDDLESVCVS